ncbi:hypothetical protein ANANG_G00288350 [Anguilla anguilla]|uniref:PHD-type domain-containing protein n=1 Tax=Anguilla anguilla TaxID=7936 RepID=A0A9D3LMC8_ANGAN|nr:hypothetical protein ANANG_G00288350 [Anguilla anguilla]
MSKNFPSDLEDKIYQDLQSQYYSDQREPAGKASHALGYSCDKDIPPEVKSETYKSEAPTDYDTLENTDPFMWRDDLRHQDHYLPTKVEDSVQQQQFGSEVEHFEEKLLSVMGHEKQEIPEEQCPIPHDLMGPEERLENRNSPSSKNSVNCRLLSCDMGESHGLAKEQGDEQHPSVDAAGKEPAVGEKRPAVRDTLTSSYSTETVFPLQGEQAVPAPQVRGNIEHRDAEVLEPDSPQLPGKSVMHPAPSWADTPPSPKKGDDDIEPGISCPSAVMPSPSAKSEPMALSSNLGALHRKHTRGRRGRPGRPSHMGARIRALVSTEDKEVPSVIASSKGTLFPDELIGISDSKDISSQMPTLSASEGFPSRMRTRSFTTQAIPKACAQLKRRPGPKPSEDCPAANPPPPPKGLISKIKCIKQRDLEQDTWGYAKGKRGLGLNTPPDENQETQSLPMVLPVKDQKSMVLRSRKQTEEIPVKEKEKKDKLPSHCVIINRPEEETLLLRERRRRKKASVNVMATSILTQATAPSFSQAMLQGPLVNAGLSGRSLTCCLCGKPANYRELGDLCGPYYPEDSVPRKALSFLPKLEHVEAGEMVGNSTTVEPNTSPLKSDSIKDPGRWGRCGSGQHRRVERVLGVGRTSRPSFREQYRRLRLLQGEGQGWGRAGLRTLQMEAEAKEHWAHEACAIWTRRVVLIAGKLYGLTEAARAAAQMCCSACQSVGASISCCREGCSQIFHFVCAKDMGCLFQEDNFSVKCVEHKDL